MVRRSHYGSFKEFTAMRHTLISVLLTAAFTASGCLGQGPADAPTSAAEALTADPDWHEMDPNDRLNASAALADWDNSLLGVWIDSAGGLRVDTSNGTQWGAIPPITPGVRLATGTSPVIVRIYDEARIFVRGQDNNLYVNLNPLCTFFNPYGSCQTWRQLTTHGRVRGRFSVFLNQPSYNVPVRVAHVLFNTAAGAVEYARFEETNQTFTQTHAWTFNGAEDGVLAASPDGAEIGVATRQSDTVRFFRLTSIYNTWVFGSLGNRTVGPSGRVYDLSNLVITSDAYQVLFSARYLSPLEYVQQYRLFHARLPRGGDDNSPLRTLAGFAPTFNPDTVGDTSVGHPMVESSLLAKGSALVALWRMPDGALRYARWNTATPTTPWSAQRAAGAYSLRRPSLALHPVRHYYGEPAPEQVFAAGIELNEHHGVAASLSQIAADDGLSL